MTPDPSPDAQTAPFAPRETAGLGAARGWRSGGGNEGCNDAGAEDARHSANATRRCTLYIIARLSLGPHEMLRAAD